MGPHFCLLITINIKLLFYSEKGKKYEDLIFEIKCWPVTKKLFCLVLTVLLGVLTP